MVTFLELRVGSGGVSHNGAVVAEQSVGELFVGAVIPGLMLSGLYILYVTFRCFLNPDLGPPIPEDERVSTREKVHLLGKMAAPIALIVIVLSSIYILYIQQIQR